MQRPLLTAAATGSALAELEAQGQVREGGELLYGASRIPHPIVGVPLFVRARRLRIPRVMAGRRGCRPAASEAGSPIVPPADRDCSFPNHFYQRRPRSTDGGAPRWHRSGLRLDVMDVMSVMDGRNWIRTAAVKVRPNCRDSASRPPHRAWPDQAGHRSPSLLLIASSHGNTVRP